MGNPLFNEYGSCIPHGKYACPMCMSGGANRFDNTGSCIPHGRYNCSMCNAGIDGPSPARGTLPTSIFVPPHQPTLPLDDDDRLWGLACSIYVSLTSQGVESAEAAQQAIGRARILWEVYHQR